MDHQEEFKEQITRRDLINTISQRIRTEYGYRKEVILDRQKFDYMINGLSGQEDDLFNEQLWEGCEKTPWDRVEITTLAKHVADVVLNPNISRDRVKRLLGIFAPGFGIEKTPEPEKNKEKMQRRQTDEGNPENEQNPFQLPQIPSPSVGWIIGVSTSIVLLGKQILNSFPGLNPKSTVQPLFSNSVGVVQPMAVISQLNTVLQTSTSNNLVSDIPKSNSGGIQIFVERCFSWFKEAIKSNFYRQDTDGKTFFNLPHTANTVFKVLGLGLVTFVFIEWIQYRKRWKAQRKTRKELMKRWADQNQVRKRNKYQHSL